MHFSGLFPYSSYSKPDHIFQGGNRRWCSPCPSWSSWRSGWCCCQWPIRPPVATWGFWPGPRSSVTTWISSSCGWDGTKQRWCVFLDGILYIYIYIHTICVYIYIYVNDYVGLHICWYAQIYILYIIYIYILCYTYYILYIIYYILYIIFYLLYIMLYIYIYYILLYIYIILYYIY